MAIRVINESNKQYQKYYEDKLILIRDTLNKSIKILSSKFIDLNNEDQIDDLSIAYSKLSTVLDNLQRLVSIINRKSQVELSYVDKLVTNSEEVSDYINKLD